MLSNENLPKPLSPGRPLVRETQRKFLVADSTVLEALTGTEIQQGYIQKEEGVEVKVRIADDKAFLTIKGVAGERGKLRFTYPIPLEHAQVMLEEYCASSRIEKTRYTIMHNETKWEVDVYKGDNERLIVAEVDLDESNRQVSIPPWADREVTDEKKYSNFALSRRPFAMWNHLHINR